MAQAPGPGLEGESHRGGRHPYLDGQGPIPELFPGMNLQHASQKTPNKLMYSLPNPRWVWRVCGLACLRSQHECVSLACFGIDAPLTRSKTANSPAAWIIVDNGSIWIGQGIPVSVNSVGRTSNFGHVSPHYFCCLVILLLAMCLVFWAVCLVWLGSLPEFLDFQNSLGRPFQRNTNNAQNLFCQLTRNR